MPIMKSMAVQICRFRKGVVIHMGEKVYKTMKSVGAFNLVAGILLIIVGIGAGISVIVGGAKLLSAKSDLIF